MAMFNKNPLNMQGAITNSGNMGNTGQLPQTYGGGQSFMRMSGITAATLLVSGPGRLDSIGWLSPLTSGQGVVFYDSNVATSGGPFQTSGNTVVGFLPPTINGSTALASGLTQNLTAPYPYLAFPGGPFQNGLCAGVYPGAVSGVGSFYGTFTAAGLTSGGGGIGPFNGIAN